MSTESGPNNDNTLGVGLFQGAIRLVKQRQNSLNENVLRMGLFEELYTQSACSRSCKPADFHSGQYLWGFWFLRLLQSCKEEDEEQVKLQDHKPCFSYQQSAVFLQISHHQIVASLVNFQSFKKVNFDNFASAFVVFMEGYHSQWPLLHHPEVQWWLTFVAVIIQCSCVTWLFQTLVISLIFCPTPDQKEKILM